MLKDITLGQFFPGKSLAHRLDPRTKLLLTVLYIAALFCAKWFVSYALTAALLAASVKVSGVSPKTLQAGFVFDLLHGGSQSLLHPRGYSGILLDF